MVATSQVAGIEVVFRARSGQFERAMNQAALTTDRATGRMTRAAQRVGKSFTALGRTLRRFSLPALAAAGGLALLAKRAIDSAEKIGKVADRIGISTDALQRYRFAADLAGVEQGKLDQALTFFGKTLGEARLGTGELVTTLKEYDQSLLDALIQTTSFEDALALAFKAMANAKDATDRLTLAQRFFSRGGAGMTILVREGTEALREMLAAADRLGLVIPEDLIRRAETLKDQMTILGTVIRANFTRGLISGFSKEFVAFADIVKDPAFIKGVQAFGDNVGAALRFMVENSREIAAVTAGLVAFSLGSKFSGLIGLLTGLAAGTVTFVALGDSIGTVEDATTRLTEKMGELRFIEAALARERKKAARGGKDAADNVQIALRERTRVLGEILQLEKAIAGAQPKARPKPAPGAGDGAPGPGGAREAEQLVVQKFIEGLRTETNLLELEGTARRKSAAFTAAAALALEEYNNGLRESNDLTITEIEQIGTQIESQGALAEARRTANAALAESNAEEAKRQGDVRAVLFETSTAQERFNLRIQELNELKPELGQERFARAVALANEELRESDPVFQALDSSLNRMIDGLVRGEASWQSFARVASDALQQILTQWLRNAAQMQSFNIGGGGVGGILGSLFKLGGSLLGGLFGGGLGPQFTGTGFEGLLSSGSFQHGGIAPAGVPALVGEGGPEMIVPSVPTAVIPAPLTRRITGGGGVVNNNIFQVDMRGADTAAVRRLERLVLEVNGSIEDRALAVVSASAARGGSVARMPRIA